MFDSGTLFICDLVNQTENGSMPKEVLHKKQKHWFERRTIGINRQYLAKGVNETIDLLVRIHRDENIEIGQYVLLGNGDQFHIDMITHGYDLISMTRMDKGNFWHGYRTANLTQLDYTELTLSKVENYYELETNED